MVLDSEIFSPLRGMKTGSDGHVRTALSSTAPMKETKSLKRTYTAQMTKDISTLNVTANIRAACAKLGLPAHVTENAIFVVVKNQHVFAAKNRSSIVAVSIYLSCRKMGITRTVKEITATTNARRRNWWGMYVSMRLAGMDVPLPNPTGHVTRLVSTLNLSEIVTRRALELLDEFSKLGLFMGKKPLSVAAYAIYTAAKDTGNPITHDALTRAADIHSYKTAPMRNEHATALMAARQIRKSEFPDSRFLSKK